jgi:hypothetical protein
MVSEIMFASTSAKYACMYKIRLNNAWKHFYAMSLVSIARNK